MQALANHSIMHPQTAIGTLRTCAMRTQAKHSAVLVTRLAAAVLLTVLSAHAQTIIPLPTPFPGPEESFTAASVKPNASGALEWDFDTPPGRVVGKNVVLRDLIRFAYNIYGGDWDIRIAGPDWMKTARFDLDATTPGVVPQPRAMSMLRQLLGERFKLRVRYEQRQRPVYALLRAGNDGRLGPQSSRHQCRRATSLRTSHRCAGPGAFPGAFVQAATPWNNSPCNWRGPRVVP
jgi:hypothetical protein